MLISRIKSIPEHKYNSMLHNYFRLLVNWCSAYTFELQSFAAMAFDRSQWDEACGGDTTPIADPVDSLKGHLVILETAGVCRYFLYNIVWSPREF